MDLLAAAVGLGVRAVGGTAEAEPPLPERPVFRPHVRSPRWGWTHYGVMLPDLPAPHRFLACMALVGATGSRIFDTDHARVDRPSRTATLVTGTATTAPDASFAAYSTRRDCSFAADGTEVRLGRDLELRGAFPALTVRGRRPGLAYDLDLDLSRAATTFARGPLWTHLSLLARYRGTITAGGRTTDVAGTGTFEHAQSAGVHGVLPVALPTPLKVPGDAFTYAVITLDDDEQLLLSHLGILGRDALTAVYHRSTTAPARRVVRGVVHDVPELQPDPATAPDGRTMALPRLLRWRTPPGSAIGLELTAEVDTPMLYGLGSGYVGGFAYEATLDGRRRAGRGYVEWIRRPRALG